MKDWTEKDGVYNRSDLYVQIVKDVEMTIRESAHYLIAGQANGVARNIVSRLAYKFKLAPPERVK